MAIDPRIALGVNPPVIAPLQLRSPIEQLGKMLSLRNLMQQGEEGQLVLQQKRLAIEQAQREEQERKSFADYLAKHLGPDAPAAGAIAPVETPPAAPLPAATAFDASGAEPQPGGPGALLSTLITSPVVRPSPPPAPLPVRGATAPAPEGGRFNIGEILTKFPRLGPAFVKSQVELDKSRHETAIKQAEAAGKTAEGLGRIALSIRDSKDPAAQFTTGVLQAVSQGLMPPAMGRQMVAEGYDKHRNDIQAFIDQAQNVKDTHETRRIELQTYGEAVQNASKTVDAVGNQAQYTSWLAEQPARLQQALGPTYSPQLKATIQSMGVSRADVPGMFGKRLAAAAQILEPARARGDDAYRTALADFPQDVQDAMGDAKTPLEVRQRALTAAQRTTAQQAADTRTETGRHNIATEQESGRHNRAVESRTAAAGANDEDLASTVIANPSLYDNLTPSAKTRISPLLAKQGFTEFGKPLGEAAMTKLAESRSAIESLKDLRQTLKDNEQYIGPIAGLQSLNPYSDARVAQAKIDLVRQRVGKALEGGVLRKEDEEKYKKILATLRDTPSTAIAKVDNLLTSIDRDIKLFEQEQRRGGRNVPAATPAAAAPGGTGPAVGTVEGGYRFKGGDPSKQENWEKK